MAPQIGGSASDGTYNPKLGVFLLPPLVGLPYPDMVANGMFPPLVFNIHPTKLFGLLTNWSVIVQDWEQSIRQREIPDTPNSS